MSRIRTGIALPFVDSFAAHLLSCHLTHRIIVKSSDFLAGSDLELLRGAAATTAKCIGLWLNAFDRD